MRERAVARALALTLGLTLALAACDREPGRGAAAADEGPAAGGRAGYDADSAARGLLTPELATLLDVEPILAAMRDTSARAGRRCRDDTLPQLGHLRRRFDVRTPEAATTVFARRARDGALRRAEVLRRRPDGTALGASWDASTASTTVSEFGGGTVKKTTSRDDDAPLARSLRYVGRAALAARCGA